MALKDEYTEAERSVAAELCAIAEALNEGAENATKAGRQEVADCNKAIGAIVLERIATIMRGDDTLRVFSDDDMKAFAEFWGAEEPAAFNRGL